MFKVIVLLPAFLGLLSCATATYQPATFDSQIVQGYVEPDVERIRALPVRVDLNGEADKSLVLGLPEMQAMFWQDEQTVTLLLKRRDGLGWLKQDMIGGDGPEPVIVLATLSQSARLLDRDADAEQQAQVLAAVPQLEWKRDWGAYFEAMGFSIAKDLVTAAVFGSDSGSDCGTIKDTSGALVSDRQQTQSIFVLREETISQGELESGGCFESGRQANCFLGEQKQPIACPAASALVSDDGRWFFDGQGLYTADGGARSAALAAQSYEAPLFSGRPATPFLLGVAPSPSFKHLALVYYDEDRLYLDFARLRLAAAVPTARLETPPD